MIGAEAGRRMENVGRKLRRLRRSPGSEASAGGEWAAEGAGLERKTNAAEAADVHAAAAAGAESPNQERVIGLVSDVAASVGSSV